MNPPFSNQPTPEEKEGSEQPQRQRDNPFARIDPPAAPESDPLDTNVHPLLEAFEDELAASIAAPEEPVSAEPSAPAAVAVNFVEEEGSGPLETGIHPLLEEFEDEIAAAIAEGSPDLHDSGETLDSLIDSVQESPTLDPQTQARLEDQDDDSELEEKKPVQASPMPPAVSVAETAESSNERESEDSEDDLSAASEWMESEAADSIADLEQEQAAAKQPTPSPAEEDSVPEASDAESDVQQVYRYRIAAVLPPALQNAIHDTLNAAELGDSLDSGVFQWQAPYLTENPQEVAAVLDAWVQQHLPIKTATKRVHSEVVGAQSYIAGWELTNAKLIYQAHTALTTQLAALINPDTNASAIFRAIVPVLPEVPAERFPQVVGFLQRNFEAQAVTIAALEILRKPVDDETSTWQVMGVFKPQT